MTVDVLRETTRSRSKSNEKSKPLVNLKSIRHFGNEIRVRMRMQTIFEKKKWIWIANGEKIVKAFFSLPEKWWHQIWSWEHVIIRSFVSCFTFSHCSLINLPKSINQKLLWSLLVLSINIQKVKWHSQDCRIFSTTTKLYTYYVIKDESLSRSILASRAKHNNDDSLSFFLFLFMTHEWKLLWLVLVHVCILSIGNVDLQYWTNCVRVNLFGMHSMVLSHSCIPPCTIAGGSVVCVTVCVHYKAQYGMACRYWATSHQVRLHHSRFCHFHCWPPTLLVPIIYTHLYLTREQAYQRSREKTTYIVIIMNNSTYDIFRRRSLMVIYWTILWITSIMVIERPWWTCGKEKKRNMSHRRSGQAADGEKAHIEAPFYSHSSCSSPVSFWMLFVLLMQMYMHKGFGLNGLTPAEKMPVRFPGQEYHRRTWVCVFAYFPLCTLYDVRTALRTYIIRMCVCVAPKRAFCLLLRVLLTYPLPWVSCVIYAQCAM